MKQQLCSFRHNARLNQFLIQVFTNSAHWSPVKASSIDDQSAAPIVDQAGRLTCSHCNTPFTVDHVFSQCLQPQQCALRQEAIEAMRLLVRFADQPNCNNDVSIAVRRFFDLPWTYRHDPSLMLRTVGVISNEDAPFQSGFSDRDSNWICKYLLQLVQQIKTSLH
jgi:hypothetical protein